MSLATLVRPAAPGAVPADAPRATATTSTTTSATTNATASTTVTATVTATAAVRLYNASGAGLRVAAYDDAGAGDVLPPVGTTVTSGGTLRLDVARPTAAGARTVVVAFETLPADGAVAGDRFLLAMTSDLSGRAGHAAPAVPAGLQHRTAGQYVVVEDVPAGH